MSAWTTPSAPPVSADSASASRTSTRTAAASARSGRTSTSRAPTPRSAWQARAVTEVCARARMGTTETWASATRRRWSTTGRLVADRFDIYSYSAVSALVLTHCALVGCDSE